MQAFKRSVLSSIVIRTDRPNRPDECYIILDIDSKLTQHKKNYSNKVILFFFLD